MIRRIFVTALGGVVGFVLPSILIPHHYFIGWRALALSITGCSSLALTVSERLRLIPTEEKVEEDLQPISIFAGGDRESRS
jgi:hypothetical protein